MNLKTLERHLRVNLLGPSPRLIKKNLPGRGLTKFEKHCSSYLVISGVAALGIKRTAACVNTYTELLLHAVAVTVFHIGILHSFEYATFMVGHHVNVLNPGFTELTAFFNECNPIVLLIVKH